MKSTVYPKLILRNKSLRISVKVVQRILQIIKDSHLLRSLLINNVRDKISVALEIMRICNNFLDYISNKERTKKITSPELVDKYEGYIHMENIRQAYYILSYIPKTKNVTIQDAKLSNIFYHHLNMSGYYKKRISKEIKNDSTVVANTINELKKEFKASYFRLKEEMEDVDMDLACKSFFETKLAKRQKLIY